MSAVLYCNGKPVQKRDNVPGGRLGKYYAEVEAIDPATRLVRVRYNGENKTYNLPAEVIGAQWITTQ
jgi:hypothetical protein